MTVAGPDCAPREAEPAEVSSKVLVVWDFDWSLINTNSDTYVVEQLRPELMARFDDREAAEQWTALMHDQMRRLFDSGVGRQEVERCLASMPIDDGCLGAVELMAKSQADQVVLSDANTVFISTFLEARGIRGLFKEILTNPGSFDEEGRLHVRPFHEGPPHGCPLCPGNLCKGAVLEQLRARYSPGRIFYVGDGGGDFCPACDLSPGDAVLCRAPPSPPLTHFGLKSRIERSRASVMVGQAATCKARRLVTRKGFPAAVAAAVHYWQSGADVLKIMSDLVSHRL